MLPLIILMPFLTDTLYNELLMEGHMLTTLIVGACSIKIVVISLFLYNP